MAFKPAPEVDEIFAHDERPPKDISDDSEDSYEAAMRAADALFSRPSSPFIASRPVTARPSQPQPRPHFTSSTIPGLPDQSREQTNQVNAKSRAEAFFKKPDTPDTPDTEHDAIDPRISSAPERRIIPDLTPVRDALAERLEEAERASRPGRRLGSKNKIKGLPSELPIVIARRGRPRKERDEPRLRIAIDPRTVTTPVQPAVTAKRRGRKLGSKNRPKIQEPTLFDLVSAEPATQPYTAPIAASVLPPMIAYQLMVHAARLSAGAMDFVPYYAGRSKPGERWKKRIRYMK